MAERLKAILRDARGVLIILLRTESSNLSISYIIEGHSSLVRASGGCPEGLRIRIPLTFRTGDAFSYCWFDIKLHG